MTAVILGTGSRTYDRPDIIRAVLAAVATRYDRDVVLRYGECRRGADRPMHQAWKALGLGLQPYPADLSGPCRKDCDHGPRRAYQDGPGDYCPAAGPRRNRDMIKAGGIDEVHGFPKGSTSGTRITLKLARAAGLRVYEWTPDSIPQLTAYVLGTQSGMWPLDGLT